MPRKHRRKARDDRVGEYIDSPTMTRRIHYKRELMLSMYGNYGVYRTTFTLGRRKESSCTCPSDRWPCKHVQALEETWKANPRSFLDLQEFLDQISTRSQSELIDAIGRMVLLAPETLSVFGLKGFEPKQDEEHEGWDTT